MKIFLLSLTLFCTFFSVQAARDISSYQRDIPAKVGETNLLGDGSFEDGGKGWVPVDKSRFSVKRGDGFNGTSGIKLTIFPSCKRILPHKWYDVKLKKGVRYKFSAYGRIDGNYARKGGISAKMCIEYWKGRKYIRGFYGLGTGARQKEWKIFSGSFTFPDNIPEDAKFKVVIVPSCPPETSKNSGAVYFDEIRLVEDAPTWSLFQVYPIAEKLYANEGFIRFSSTFSGPFKGSKNPEYQIKVTRNGKVLAVADAQVKGARVTAELGKLTPGKAEVTVTLYSSKDKKIYAEETKTVEIVDYRQLPANACTIDRLGRANVDGKLFMPIGLYMIGNNEVERLQIISEAKVFNTVLLYHASRFKTKEAMTAFLDACVKNNLKLLYASGFSEKYLNEVKAYHSHPAILGWYIDDETSISKLDHLLYKRRSVNALDPFHPTYAVSCFPGDFSEYNKACDILGYDPYPVRETSVTPTLSGILSQSDPAEKLDSFSWAVPQIFSWGSYDNKAKNNKELYYKLFREPTEIQMRGMVLTEVLAGSKGFIMYMFCNIRDLNIPDPDSFARRWPEVCRVAGMLKELEPFILSDIEQIKLPVQLNKKDHVRAALFDDAKGNIRVIICGMTLDHDAIITLPEKYRNKELKSKFGLTKSLGNGKYQFTGKDCAADILY